MSDLKIIHTETKGIVHITTNSQYNNIKADHVVLAENTVARLYGTINGKVTLKKGSRMFIHGEFSGNIENEGGELCIFK